VVRAGRQQRLEQVYRPVRLPSSDQAAGLADKGVGIALRGVLPIGIEGIEHLAGKLIRGIQFQGPEIKLPCLSEMAGLNSQIAQDQQRLGVLRIGSQDLFIVDSGLVGLLHRHVEKIAQVLPERRVRRIQGHGFFIGGQGLGGFFRLAVEDPEIVVRGGVVRIGLHQFFQRENGFHPLSGRDEQFEDSLVGFGGPIGRHPFTTMHLGIRSERKMPFAARRCEMPVLST